jgi:tetratricopeptide (TPR) repeat protein
MIWRAKGDVALYRRLLPAIRRCAALATEEADRQESYARLFGVLYTLNQKAPPLSKAEQDEALGAAAIALDGASSDVVRVTLYVRRSRLRLKTGALAGAMRDADAALAIDAEDLDSLMQRLDVLGATSGYDDAYAELLAELTQVVEDTKEDNHILTRAWLFHLARPKDTDVTRSVYERLLAARPDNRGRRWTRLALLRLQAGQRKLAQRAFATAFDQLKGSGFDVILTQALGDLLERFAEGAPIADQIRRVAALVVDRRTNSRPVADDRRR